MPTEISCSTMCRSFRMTGKPKRLQRLITLRQTLANSPITGTFNIRECLVNYCSYIGFEYRDSFAKLFAIFIQHVQPDTRTTNLHKYKHSRRQFFLYFLFILIQNKNNKYSWHYEKQKDAILVIRFSWFQFWCIRRACSWPIFSV